MLMTGRIKRGHRCIQHVEVIGNLMSGLVRGGDQSLIGEGLRENCRRGNLE